MTVQRARFDLINYRFLTTEIDLKALYIFRCFITTLSVKLFVVTLQIFVYNSENSEKGKTTLTKPFTFWKWKHIAKKNHILENESSFWNPFWR